MTSHSEPLLITAYPTEFPDSFGEDRRAMVRHIFDSMKLAYGSQFCAQLRSANKPNNPTAFDWKCHMLEISQPYTADQVLDAFDQCMTASPDWPPTMQRILAQMQINALDARRREEQEDKLRKVKEQPNFNNVEKIKEILGQVGKGLKTGKKDASGEDAGERAMASLRKCLEYETRLWEHTPDKTMPRTRAAALAASSATGLSAPQCAADAAEQIGCEILSKFTQICVWMSPRELAPAPVAMPW
jgi:hypothetical protein